MSIRKQNQQNSHKHQLFLPYSWEKIMMIIPVWIRQPKMRQTFCQSIQVSLQQMNLCQRHCKKKFTLSNSTSDKLKIDWTAPESDEVHLRWKRQRICQSSEGHFEIGRVSFYNFSESSKLLQILWTLTDCNFQNFEVSFWHLTLQKQTWKHAFALSLCFRHIRYVKHT